ncbi:MAG: DUF512 domain-containing protein [Tissierellia bacterium]|nr:DUF512 domain-containing protein [Tissierellia bacterium]
MIFKIIDIEENSIAWELDIKAGSYLKEINGKEIEDRLDYLFLTSQDYVEILIEEDGEDLLLEIEKEDDEDLGFVFEHPLMDEARTCHNKCVFCFIDQLPKGLRKSLYFKDDDSRLSFMQGNFVTLTNVTNNQLGRIVDYGIHPINVSIHSLDPEIRVKMMGSPKAANIVQQLDFLAMNRVNMNGQIVLVPGYNDGASLYKTLEGLLDYSPYLSSVAIVPVGISQFREGLAEVRPINKAEALELIKRIHEIQEENLKKLGSRFVFLADEFYIKAGLELPPAHAYEGYVQIENGVGLVRNFLEDIEKGFSKVKKFESPCISLISGELFAPILDKALDKYRARGLNIRVEAIENKFFGKDINVSGLMVYEDIIGQVQKNADVYFLPSSILNYDELSLDDVPKEKILSSFNRAYFVEPQGQALVDMIKEVSHGTSSSHCWQT